MIYCEYDRKTKIVSLLLGDVAACFSFNKRKTFDRFSFYGLESKFSEAPVNDGSSQETILSIDADVLNAFNSILIPKIQTIRLKEDKKKILALWGMAINKLGMPLPQKPVEPFIQFVIKSYTMKLSSRAKKLLMNILPNALNWVWIDSIIFVYNNHII